MATAITWNVKRTFVTIKKIKNINLLGTSWTPLYATKSGYAKKPSMGLGGKSKGKGAIGVAVQKKRLPVETDPHKLVNYVCGSNIYKDGQDIKIKDDSEYPDWIWDLRLGPFPSLEELDPNTLQYWERLHLLNVARGNRLLKTKRLGEMRVNEAKKLEKLKAIRFRALAFHYHDPGVEVKGLE
ncbi:39S ribosomal protein L54, mitochondrial-like isoform X2 [Limulus polyphemus]|uniref:Large ribosomal subunit protein mL54 n=1 Tax=Limulus polyphemus TaxID=6850 RepID=A0ABM1RUI0_LIMPO|nr:39S ribosomal protein L54, mitochondrial-like isoform X2 [Limulus polyphemus]